MVLTLLHESCMIMQLKQQHPSSSTMKIKYVTDIAVYFNINKKIGNGHTATVYEATSRLNGQEYALKVVKKEQQRQVAKDSYYRDIYQTVPPLFQHHNVKIYDMFEDQDHFYIAMERCHGPDMVEYVLKYEPGAIEESLCKKIIMQILCAINVLHQNRVVHRDIKLDNLIFRRKMQSDVCPSQSEVVLLDYDMCMLLDRPDQPKEPQKAGEVSIVGTREYMAPESFKGEYYTASDVWSCGIVLYVLLDGHFPFDIAQCKSGREYRQVLKQGARKSRFERHLLARNPQAAQLVSWMLTYDKTMRCPNAFEALSHPWLSEVPRPVSMVRSDMHMLHAPVQPCVVAFNKMSGGDFSLLKKNNGSNVLAQVSSTAATGAGYYSDEPITPVFEEPTTSKKSGHFTMRNTNIQQDYKTGTRLNFGASMLGSSSAAATSLSSEVRKSNESSYCFRKHLGGDESESKTNKYPMTSNDTRTRFLSNLAEWGARDYAQRGDGGSSYHASHQASNNETAFLRNGSRLATPVNQLGGRGGGYIM